MKKKLAAFSKRQAEQSGRFAEALAKLCLRLKGYRILSDRHPGLRGTKYGEVDIIAQRSKSLVFIEVKKRASFSLALEAITRRQQRRIYEGAKTFLYAHPSFAYFNMRFDVIILNRFFMLRHLPDAFRAPF